MTERISNPPPQPGVKPGLASTRRFDSRVLFHDTQEIVIVHAGQEYRLRITRYDKLILTK